MKFELHNEAHVRALAKLLGVSKLEVQEVRAASLAEFEADPLASFRAGYADGELMELHAELTFETRDEWEHHVKVPHVKYHLALQVPPGRESIATGNWSHVRMWQTIGERLLDMVAGGELRRE